MSLFWLLILQFLAMAWKDNWWRMGKRSGGGRRREIKKWGKGLFFPPSEVKICNWLLKTLSFFFAC